MKLLISLVAVGFLSSSVATSTERPNIVFIFADDWGWGDLGCHDHPYLKTPHLDQLAAEGTEFRQFTVASGVCSPSRAAVLTGHFPARHSIHGHFATVESHRKRGMPDWLDPDVVLLPRLLQQAGYATAHFGKWHLTNIMVPDAPRPSEYGYDEYGAFNCSGPQMPVHDDVKRSIAFIKKCRAEKKPFFLNLWIHEPHTPHYPQPKYLTQFAHLEKEPQRIYAAVLAHADARIGELLATLDDLEFQENTLVIFSSDNGPENTGTRRAIDDESTGPGLGTFASVGSTGGHRGRKRSLLQGGIGVPFIVRWPGKTAKGNIDDTTPITAVDLLPTFCAIAGRADSGRLCFPMASINPRRCWESQTQHVTNPFSGSGDTVPSAAITGQRWRCVMAIGRCCKAPARNELSCFDFRRIAWNAMTFAVTTRGKLTVSANC